MPRLVLPKTIAPLNKQTRKVKTRNEMVASKESGGKNKKTLVQKNQRTIVTRIAGSKFFLYLARSGSFGGMIEL